jgi:Secretion system C-terminal sorting domain
MKTNGTLQNILRRSFFFIALLFLSLVSFSQPDYIFTKAVLESGKDLELGAVYRFSEVKPGTDALVTITDISKISLTKIDGPSGFDEAFQPYILCPGKTKGYVEFRFDFVEAGTSKAKVMKEVPVTAIDIDGYEFPDEKLYESDQFEKSASYYVDYDLLGSSLNIKYSGSWVEAVNTSAITYDGIDTTQRDVMISMVYANVSSINIRVGAENKSKSPMERLRSDYFMKFKFASSLLAKSPLNLFKGFAKNNKVSLQWNIATSNLLKKVIVEKAETPSQFSAIGEVLVNSAQQPAGNYTFNDNAVLQKTGYYRLKMIEANGQLSYSNVLVFRIANDTRPSFKMYPSIINDNATVNITADKTEQTSLQVFDLGGRSVYQKNFALQQGNNNVAVNGFSSLQQGTYVAIVKAGNSTYSQKIMIQ